MTADLAGRLGGSSLVRSRVAASHRVRVLMADALTFVASAAYGVKLTAEDALSLAAVGDIEHALDSLAAQMRTPRTTSTTQLSRQAQQSVAITEVVVDELGTFAGDPRARVDFLRDVLERHVSLEKAARALDATAAAVDALLAEESRASMEIRTFLRRAAGLRTLQCNRLSAEIVDPTQRARALAELDAVYARHLAKALGLPAVVSSDDTGVAAPEALLAEFAQ